MSNVVSKSNFPHPLRDETGQTVNVIKNLWYSGRLTIRSTVDFESECFSRPWKIQTILSFTTNKGLSKIGNSYTFKIQLSNFATSTDKTTESALFQLTNLTMPNEKFSAKKFKLKRCQITLSPNMQNCRAITMPTGKNVIINRQFLKYLSTSKFEMILFLPNANTHAHGSLEQTGTARVSL